MANNMYRAARHSGDHRFSMGGFILRRENRLMEARNEQVQRGQHRPGAVNFAEGVFYVGFNTP